MKQGSKEWHKARAGRITASRIGAVLGVDPHRTRADLIREMVREYHGAPSEFEGGNVATQWGTNNEPVALLDYMGVSGFDVQECGFFVHPEHDWIGASPDGLLGEQGLLEIKCPFGQRDKNPPQFKTLEEQRHYYAQVQLQLACTGREWAHFYQWAPHASMVERVDAEPGWLEKHLPGLERFRSELSAELDNPAHLEDKRVILDDAKHHRLVAEHHSLAAQITNARARQAEIIEQLAEESGGRSAEIGEHKLTLVRRAGSVSYSKVVRDLLPDVDLEPYRGKSSEHWRLS